MNAPHSVSSGTHPGQSRTVGAAVALALDIGLLAVAGLLVAISVSEATGIALAALVGLVIAPVLGWQNGASAVGVVRASGLRPVARSLLLADLVLLAAEVVYQVFNVPPSGGLLGAVSYLAYVAMIWAVVIAVLTLVVAIPIGFVWGLLMRRWARWHRAAS
jgi:hypothetical protein